MTRLVAVSQASLRRIGAGVKSHLRGGLCPLETQRRLIRARIQRRAWLGRRPSARDECWLGGAQLGSGQLANARISLQEA
jgi:hypothetical protein